jgi:hypothetical protein
MYHAMIKKRLGLTLKEKKRREPQALDSATFPFILFCEAIIRKEHGRDVAPRKENPKGKGRKVGWLGDEP